MDNYDSSQVGVPYVRVHRITINYPESGLGLLPSASLEQSLAVKLADGTSRKLADLPTISRSFDLTNDGNDAIPLVDPTTGVPLGANTSLNQVMLVLLAVVRNEQTKVQ